MTFDEARLMANVNARAGRLFDDGYRARWRGGQVLEVRSPQGATYRVDTRDGTCDCPFFRGHQGRHPCKHVLGWKRLLARQRACRRLIALVLVRIWADLDDAQCTHGGGHLSPDAGGLRLNGGTEATHGDA